MKMEKQNLFYIVFVLTILLFRIFLFLFPALDIDVIILGFEIHHIGFGLIIVLIGLVMPNKHPVLKTIVFAVGFGMVIDEVIFIALGAGKVATNYWAPASLIGTAILAISIFPLRKRIMGLVVR